MRVMTMDTQMAHVKQERSLGPKPRNRLQDNFQQTAPAVGSIPQCLVAKSIWKEGVTFPSIGTVKKEERNNGNVLKQNVKMPALKRPAVKKPEVIKPAVEKPLQMCLTFVHPLVKQPAESNPCGSRLCPKRPTLEKLNIKTTTANNVQQNRKIRFPKIPKWREPGPELTEESSCSTLLWFTASGRSAGKFPATIPKPAKRTGKTSVAVCKGLAPEIRPMPLVPEKL
ncbi:uncharacterized protein [Hoplias malabaricus]|uniref:uncharacterized protein n=1 Tax=Hoplias malabaricus TaxID=27720 RepID=UPI003463667E